MAFFSDELFDAGLQVLRDAVTPVLHLCSSEPATYAATLTASLGNKTAPTIGAQADRVGGGRQVSIATFTDGTVTATGTGTHWVLVDANDSRLLAAVAAGASQAVTSGNDLQLTSPCVFAFQDAV